MKEEPLLAAGCERVISLATETQFAASGIVSRTVFATPTTRVILFGFAPGQEMTEHSSTRHALVQILSGECEFTLAGRKQVLQAGDFLHMPPGLPHALLATQQFSMLLTLTKPEELSPVVRN